MNRSRRIGRLALIAALVAALAAFVAACGDDDDSDSGVDSGAAASADSGGDAPADVPEEKVQETVNQVMGAEVPVSDLDPLLVKGFTQASQTLTDAQLDKAYECWSESQCTVGDGEVTLAIVDGNDNTWRKFTKMEAILQALTYPEIGKIIYTNANGDVSQMQANIRSVTAQGAKAIITYDDFGPAVGPAFAAAQRAGAKVSNYLGPVDVGPETITTQVIADNCQIGKDMADAGAEALGGKGNVVYFNGTPGNPQGATWNKCSDEQLAAEHPDVKQIAKVDTSWSSAGASKAAAGLISAGKDVDAIFYDFADPLVDVVKTYQKAGKPTPDMVTWTENNGLYGVWEKALGTDDEFKLYGTSNLGGTSRMSVTAVMELLAGEELPNIVQYPVPFFEVEKGAYQADRPDDLPGNSSLIPDALIDRMLQQ